MSSRYSTPQWIGEASIRVGTCAGLVIAHSGRTKELLENRKEQGEKVLAFLRDVLHASEGRLLSVLPWCTLTTTPQQWVQFSKGTFALRGIELKKNSAGMSCKHPPVLRLILLSGHTHREQLLYSCPYAEGGTSSSSSSCA